MSREPNDNRQFEESGEGDDKVIGQAFRRSLVVIVLMGACAGGTFWWLNRTPPPPPELISQKKDAAEREEASVATPRVLFKDVTQEAGLNFTHVNGATGEKLLPETMGGGCAFLDYDNDGDQDILMVNSAPWTLKPGEKPPTMALFQNDGRGKFRDATEEAGLNVSFYGMGAACGDYDNDGWVDLFFTAVGKNRLFKNTQGKFAEVTDEAGVAGNDAKWSTGSAFLDYDNDGDLDLFVVNYVDWTKENDSAQGFQLVGGGRAYGAPQAFQGTFPFLYRNEGNGKFADVSEPSGVQVKNAVRNVPAAKSLGVVPVDLDRDGFMDIIVANDTVQNFVFHNQKNGTFKETAIEWGIAFDPSGGARGGMGADCGHFRNDSELGIIVGNFAKEMTALYVSQGDPTQYSDDAVATGLGPPTRLELTFGLFFFDYDLDGRLDILANNGHLENEINKVESSQHYEQPPHLFWNCGPGQKSEFVSVSGDDCGGDLVKPLVGRGSSFADIDGDGDLDCLLAVVGGSPRLLRNDLDLGHHWLRVKLIGTKSNRDSIGAWIETHVGGKILRRQVMPTRSYLSQVELPVTFGLGKETAVEKVTVYWPGGGKQEIVNPAIDKLLEIKEEPQAPTQEKQAAK